MIEGEAQLIRQIQRGKTDKFGELYDTYSPQIYRFIFLKVSSREEAEDLTHQVFLKALERIDVYEEKGNPFSSWLYEIARNQVIDYYRTHRTMSSLVSLEALKPEIFVGLAGMAEAVDGSLELEKVRTAMSRLKPEYQDVVIMRFVEELSLKETADALKRSVGAIKLLQFRALENLRKELNLS